MSGCSSVVEPKKAGETLAFFAGDNTGENLQKEYQVSAPWDKGMYDFFYERKKNVPEDLGRIYGGIIPHHLLAGHMSATMFEALSQQNPSTVVIFGPNHFSRGTSNVISTQRDWKTVYGTVPTHHAPLGKLAEKRILGFDEEAVSEEHSIYALIPFVRKSLPQTRVVPLILKNDLSHAEMDVLAKELKNIMPEDTVYLASIDFSHYQTLPVAAFHDDLSRGVIRSFDFDRLHTLEIDSVPSLRMVMNMMLMSGAQKVGFELHENAATLTGALSTKETTSYYSPYFIKGEPNKKRTASILHVGDIMLGREVKSYINRYGMDYLFEPLDNKEKRFWEGYDIGMGNLEGPFANYRRQTSKSIAFRFDPADIPGLTERNFNLFTLANNHATDMGREALLESKENLSEAGIDYFGMEYGLGDESVFTKEIGGLKIGFAGFNDTHSPLNLDKIQKIVQDLDNTVDHTIVSIHWGSEYKLFASNARQQQVAHALVDAGADVVVGHHPHVIQEMEVYKDRQIFYSLGNFMFDQYWSEPTQKGLAVGLVFHDTDAISSYLFFNESQKTQVSLTAYEKASGILNQFLEASRLADYDFDKTYFKFTTYIK